MPWIGTITQGGLSLLMQWTGGRTLTITRAAAGTGTASGNLYAQTTLTDQRQEASIVANEAVNTGRRLTIQITPPATSYELNQIGVWGKLDNGGEKLLAIYQNQNGTEIPGRTKIPDFSYTFYALLNFSNNGGDLTVEMDTSALLTVEQGVRHDTAQILTEAEKATARTNIGAASLADLAKKPDALKVSTTLHVAKTGSDTTGDGSESKPYLTIQKAVDSLPKLLIRRPTIHVHAGTYEENVLVEGFGALDSLILDGVSGETVKLNTLKIRNCVSAAPVYLANLELIGTSGDGYNWSLFCDSCSYIRLDAVTCTQAVASSNYGAFTFQYTPTVKIMSCTISNKAVALDVLASAVYLNNTVTGADNTVGIRCGSGWGQAGGYVQKGGASIAGEEQKGYGGQIW